MNTKELAMDYMKSKIISKGNSVRAFYDRNLGMIIFFVVLLLTLFLTEGCRKVIIYKGKYKVISRKIDTSLTDSILIVGKVVSAIDTVSPILNARIWTNELAKDTHSDSKGLYNLKLPSGTYTINCQADFRANEFMETIKNISFLPSEKVEIYFYIGGKIE